MPTSLSDGEYGESSAAAYLRRERGFRILAQNWRNPFDRREEIDLVADDRGILVFVEVKLRAADARVPGYYAVDRRKKEALRRACRAYLRRLRERPRTFRFDIVEVESGDGPPVVRHFQSVPLFSKWFRG